MDQVHGVVWTGSMGWSMDPGPCFVYVHQKRFSEGGTGSPHIRLEYEFKKIKLTLIARCVSVVAILDF